MVSDPEWKKRVDERFLQEKGQGEEKKYLPKLSFHNDQIQESKSKQRFFKNIVEKKNKYKIFYSLLR